MVEINHVYNMDCETGMRAMEPESVDCVITDPPYGIDYQSMWVKDSKKRKNKISGDKAPYIWFLRDAFRIIKDDGFILCFCRWDTAEAFRKAIEWAGFVVKSQIVWDRCAHGMGNLKSQFAPKHDLIWFATKGKYIFPGKRPPDIIHSMRVSGQSLKHPNEKPVDLLEQLILSTTQEGDVVCDPFLGSGTTGVACVKNSRNFIGFDVDANYCEIATQRIQEACKKQEGGAA